MFTSKSFDLVTEDPCKKKKREQLYQPRRMRWMKYIAIPALVGFVLLLILVNVDFSYDVEVDATTTHAGQTTNDDWLNETASVEAAATTPQESTQATQAPTDPNTNCSITDCSVRCSGTLHQLDVLLATQPHNCTSCYDVRLEHCYFDSGSLSSDFFKSDFQLCSLEILDCELVEIEQNAFQHESVLNMTSLSLINTKLFALRNASFQGLSNLTNFTLINPNTKSSLFAGVNFLQPLATSLLHVKIQINSATFRYAPRDWFGESVFDVLMCLDLADNTLAGQMNLSTFGHMPMLSNLNLANCMLSTLAAPKLADTWPMLRHIDVSANNLTALSDEFIEAAFEHEVHLELFGNNWNCSCINAKLLEYSQTAKFHEKPRCASPMEFVGDALNEVKLDCLGLAGNTTKTPTLSILSEITTNITEAELEVETTTSSPYTGITAPVKSTSATPTTTTTTNSSSSEEVNLPEFNQTFTCSKPAEPNSTTDVQFYYDAVMHITDMSSSSVHIVLYGNLVADWQLVYTLDGITIAAKHNVQLGEYIFVQIESLQCRRSYVFCLVLDNAWETLPLNCRAHRLPRCECSWFEMHQVLIICLSILIIVFCALLGVFLMYFLLRWRPTWLKGSKRLVRATQDSRQMLLFKKKKVKFVIDEAEYDISLAPKVVHVNVSNYQAIRKPELDMSAQMSPNELAPPTPTSSTSSAHASHTTMRLRNEAFDPNQMYEELI